MERVDSKHINLLVKLPREITIIIIRQNTPDPMCLLGGILQCNIIYRVGPISWRACQLLGPFYSGDIFCFPGKRLILGESDFPFLRLSVYQACLEKVQFGFSSNFGRFNFTGLVQHVPKMAISGFKEIPSVETRNNIISKL